MDTSSEAGEPYGLLTSAAITIGDGTILWCGEAADLPTTYQNWPQSDLAGRLVTPGLIDCHSHIIYGGSRVSEFEQRLNGASYEQIARAGGGILSTVEATRRASFDDLLDGTLARVDRLIGEGVTSLEIKSGYGLDIDTELKMLRVARCIGELRPVRVKTSFLGAHTVPGEYAGRADAYIDEICVPALEAAASEGLVDAVDGFCEGIGFTPGQIERLFVKATDLDIPVKLHAEQLSNLGGTALASKFGALSADHLEYLDEPGIAAMAEAGTIAVLLPGAFYTLRERQFPPVEGLRQHGVPIAIATDRNPGSSPLASVLLAMNMACTLFRLTPYEALAGVTINAAKALGLEDVGVIASGMRADLAIWNCRQPAELSYHIGLNLLHQRYYGGVC